MSESITVDDKDRMILAALQRDGRASWQTIAAALEMNESTVARRAQRLADADLLRVVGVVDAFRCGLGVPIVARLACRPGHIDEAGAALAARSDVRFVAVMTGTAHAMVEFVAATRADLHRIVTETLPSVEGIERVDPLVVLRTFKAAHDWDPGLLSPRAKELLHPIEGPPFESKPSFAVPQQLDALDVGLIGELMEDGRASYARLAQLAGVSEATVGRRVEALLRRGCIRIRSLAEPSLLGFDIELMVWIRVAPHAIDDVGRRLAAHPSIKYLVAAIGKYQIFGRAAVMHHEDLYEFTTSVLGGDGVLEADITFELQTLKRSWIPTTMPVRRFADREPSGGRPESEAASTIFTGGTDGD